MMNQRIYHLTSQDEWNQAESVGKYRPKAFDEEGFIHCSYTEQLVKVANSIFIGKQDLVLLHIDRSKLKCKVIDENLSRGAELFAHIYGLLPVEAVVAVTRFPCHTDGTFTLPAELKT